MENPPVPAPANSDNNDENADNAPAGPNTPALHQPASPNPAGPAMPVPNMQPVPNLLAPQIVHQQVLNWSHFKPEFTGRHEGDVEAHLLHTNDWMIP